MDFIEKPKTTLLYHLDVFNINQYTGRIYKGNFLTWSDKQIPCSTVVIPFTTPDLKSEIESHCGQEFFILKLLFASCSSQID